MSKVLLIVAALLGALSVALGAYFSHGVEFANAHAEEVVRKGLLYHQFHVAAMLLAGILDRQEPRGALRVAMLLFLAGIILFSGSLYLYGGVGLSFFARVTPIGGMAFIGGWIAFAVGLFGLKKNCC